MTENKFISYRCIIESRESGTVDHFIICYVSVLNNVRRSKLAEKFILNL